MSKRKLILVGNGMAGMRTIEELLELDPDLYQITVFGDEPHGNYNRIMLSALLSNEKTVDQIMLNDRSWYDERGIDLFTGEKIVSIDRGRRRVITESGIERSYDKLILATGSRPIVLPVPGHDLDGVVTFRDLRDVDTMLEVSRTHRKAAVIGGGLLGLEAAYGLMQQGMEVTVVHLLDHLMEKQLDGPAATLLRKSLENRGLRFRFQAKTDAILGDGRVQKMRFADGSELEADLIVMAVGIRPNKELAEASDLPCERGVLVNDVMQTFDPRIYAVGECVQHRGETFGLVAPLYEQARVVANQLAEDGYFQYRGSFSSTRLKVTGIDVFSAGDIVGAEGAEKIVFNDPSRGVYKKLIVRGNELKGALLYGDVEDASWYTKLMREGTNVNPLRETIIFGRSASVGGDGEAEELPDDTQICDCNGVCKGTIVEAIRTRGLKTLSEVVAQTKAGASCGNCQSTVETILARTLGEDYEADAVPAVCGCTELGHEAVRTAISEGPYRNVLETMVALGWKSPEGCGRCRPAINYYLLCFFPDEHQDDSRSRFINERVHANIQKDGTYSVIPRMWGGATTPQELRAIAEVAEKYDVRSVTITGGQRIALFGIPKEDLPGIWEILSDAGMVSGHAYAKGLRTVKTCVGSEWCRFGVQDSTKCGIELEKACWGSYTPHKFKMGVSGCPRNCAEATIKDFGVIGTASGWELYVGGNGGMKVRSCDLLCRVETEAEVIEYAGAFMQLHRESSYYGERTAPWIERVGLRSVRERLVDDASERTRLWKRFVHSQERAQLDPWKERAQGADAYEFEPLATLESEDSR